MKKYALLLPSLIVPIISALGQDIKKFDTNNDNRIQDSELRAIYLVLVAKANFSDYFQTDGTLDEALIRGEVLSFKAEMQGGTGDLDIKTVQDHLSADTKLKAVLKRLGILVRANHEDITIADPAKPFGKAEAALFSFTKNYKTNSYSFLAKGSLLRPIPLNKEGKYLKQLVPSITFNRVRDSKDSTKEANSLVGRVGYNMARLGGQKINAFFLKVFASYATDFDFKSEVYAAELEAEIVALTVGIGAFRRAGFLEYLFNVTPHAEYGVVKDKGNKEKLVEDDPFLRLGAQGTFAIHPVKLKSLEFTTAYTYLYGAKGSPQHFENFSQKANYALDAKKRFSLSLEYNKGKVPLSLDEIENLIFGISVKL